MVRYQIRLVDPHLHRVQVRAELPPQRGPLDLHMASWSPGSYLLRDYARHVQGVRARDAKGRALTVTKTGPSSWRIAAAGSSKVRVDYEVYAFERTVRTSHVTADHAFLHGPTLFLFSERHRRQPCSVRVAPPKGWRVECPLPEKRQAFVAADLDELLDSPIECGRPTAARFSVQGTPFRTLFCGPNDADATRVKRDFAGIAKAQRAIFDGFPFERYLAIVNFTGDSRGGLEHRASMAVEWPGNRFDDGEQYQDFLSLLSHELYHAWNIKASLPAAFRPFRYLEASPTRLLWWFEGVTDYYAVHVLLRAGLIDAAEYLRRLAGRWQQLLATPGRSQMSVADASFDAWVKLYRPDENTVNSTVSYYLKGHLLGALLDLELRQRTGGEQTLDDVSRLVFQRGRRGLPEDGVETAVAKVLRAPADDWFAANVYGTGELPFAAALETAGLRVRRKRPRSGAWLGVTLQPHDGRGRVKSVLDGSPAATAGLSAKDEIVALDGVRADAARIRERFANRAPGDRVTLTLFREDRLRELEATLGSPPGSIEITANPRADDAQRRRYREWLGEDLGDLEPVTGRPQPSALRTT